MGVNSDASELRRLFLFDAVCKAGGIGQAADRVGRSQPAVSLSIAKLERDFGVKLFERGYAGSELTPEGAILHRRVRRMREQIERGIAELIGASDMQSPAVAGICRHLSSVQVRTHIAIVQRGSAVDAARHLGVSQPAVHRAARQIEQTVGVTLYRRRVNSIAANQAGAEFARCLSLALYEIEQASEDLSSARGLSRGRVAIGVLPMTPPRLVARAMQRLLRLYPDAVMTVDEGPHARLLSDLKFGTIDLIIGALREPRLGGDVVEHELFGDPYVVAARDGHPLAGRATIRKTDLAAFDWVVPQRHVPRRAVIDGLLGQLPAIPRQVIETSSLAMMMATLVESDCLTLLARSQIHQAFSGSEIVALPLAAPESVRTVGMTTRADWLATAVQEAFMAQLREESIRHSTPPTPLARRAARR